MSRFQQSATARHLDTDRVGLSGRTSGRERREIGVPHGLLQQPGRRHDRQGELSHPQLVEQGAPQGMLLIVPDALGEEHRIEPVRKRQR